MAEEKWYGIVTTIKLNLLYHIIYLYHLHYFYYYYLFIHSAFSPDSQGDVFAWLTSPCFVLLLFIHSSDVKVSVKSVFIADYQ